MSSDNAWNMYIFRNGRRTVPGRQLTASLARRLRALVDSPADPELTLSALLEAGELEAALADMASPDLPRVQSITDSLASLLLAPSLAGCWTSRLLDLLAEVTPPPQAQISPHEGFAYYALHPLDFGELAGSIPDAPSYAVIGIRSIGTTLSAMTAAHLKTRGVSADRITVRPFGHPYDRRTTFTADQVAWVGAHRDRRSQFVIADEGPGISGSSFLSVADALIAAGVEPGHITFLCSRQPDSEHLRAPNAAQRWLAIRAFYLDSTRRVPPEAALYLGAGAWRAHFLPDPAQWPASWITMERIKFLSADGRWLFKFEGLGHFGETLHARAQLLAEAGFSPPPTKCQHGFIAYPTIAGAPLWQPHLNQVILDRIAEYCAFRAAHLPAPHAPLTELQTMVRVNLREEFGLDDHALVSALECADPVIADGRMLPHEWISTAERIFKVDGVGHGDDHFFPGPTDIAWDLAGAIVEWRLDAQASEYLLQRYRQLRGGRGVAHRVRAFLLAYSVFRMAFCKMGTAAMRGTEEEPRLQTACAGYRQLVAAQLSQTLKSSAQPVVWSCQFQVA